MKETVLLVLLLLGWLAQPLRAQTVKDRSYAYGVQIARGLQYQGLKGDELSPRHFLKGFKAGFDQKQEAVSAASHQICLRLTDAKRTTRGQEAQEMAYTKGLVVSGTIAPYIEDPNKEFDYKALKRGYEDWLYRRKRSIDDERTLEIYIQYSRELDNRRLQQATQPAPDPFQVDLSVRKDRSYAFGAQAAAMLQSINEADKTVLDADAFVEGIKAALSASMEELIQSEVIAENYAVYGLLPQDPKTLSYHMGRKLLRIPVRYIDGIAYQFDFTALKKGFQTIVQQKEPRFNEREINERIDPFLDELLDKSPERGSPSDLRTPVRLQYIPYGDPPTVEFANRIEKRSYALGVWTYSILTRTMNLPPAAIDATALWQGLQVGQTLPEEDYAVLFRLMQRYQHGNYLPLNQTSVSYDVGRFALANLVGYLGTGVQLKAADIQEAAFRKGFEAAKSGQVIGLSQHTIRGVVDDYRIAIVDRLALEKEPTPSAQKMRSNLSYAFGVKLAEHNQRTLRLPEGQTMDQALRGIHDAIDDGRALYEEVPNILNVYQRTGEAPKKEPIAYYLGVKSLGEVTFWEPLPYKAFDIDRFRKGYQDGTTGAELEVPTPEIYSLFEDYKAHLKRRKDQLMRAAE